MNKVIEKSREMPNARGKMSGTFTFTFICCRSHPWFPDSSCSHPSKFAILIYVNHTHTHTGSLEIVNLTVATAATVLGIYCGRRHVFLFSFAFWWIYTEMPVWIHIFIVHDAEVHRFICTLYRVRLYLLKKFKHFHSAFDGR